MDQSRTTPVGISGFSAYLPPYRVCLEAWSEWTGNDWEKIRAVVGESFRIRGPEQSVYTLAATAVIRLIQSYDIDPGRVSFIGFGTESSTDNSAGGIIVKGMVNQALKQLGLPLLARGCEVPEYKHACLGGLYAMKGALRYLASDGAGQQAIVVSSDLAQYELGSSGEQTQGSGAVAMLLEEAPALIEIDLKRAGKSSDYRTMDFRKPFSRFLKQTPGHNAHLNDFPLFNGSYSTACYLDATVEALRDMFRKRNIEPHEYLANVDAVFMHRPYRRMPESGLALCYLVALGSGDDASLAELKKYCESAGETLEAVLDEIRRRPDLDEAARFAAGVYPRTMQAVRAFRQTPRFREVVLDKMALGAELVAGLGNLYTASLPAWLAAGLEDAWSREIELDGADMLMIGYGSGDAAEAIPFRVVPGWRKAAARIGLADAMAEPLTLDQQEYEQLHAGLYVELDRVPAGEFVVTQVGGKLHAGLEDEGIEYYAFLS